MEQLTEASVPVPALEGGRGRRWAQRVLPLLVLLIALVATFLDLSARHYLSAPYSLSYMSLSLISAVPL